MNKELQQKPQPQSRFNLESAKYSLSAFFSTMVLQFFHPLDVIKTRLQSHDGGKQNIVPKYNSLKHSVQSIFKDEGIKGFYRGVVWSVCAQSISRMVFFTLYEVNKKWYKKHNNGKLEQRHVLFSSLQSGVLATCITTPLWVVKTRLLLNVQTHQSGIRNTLMILSDIYKEYGIKGYWRGLSVSLPLCLHGVIQMQAYEYLQWLQTHMHNEKHESNNQQKQATLSGFLSKITAICVTYPLQTLRTRLQQKQYVINNSCSSGSIPKYKNTTDLIVKMVKKEGVTSFYKGITPSIMLNAPSQAIYFFCYETFKQLLHAQDNSLSD